MAPDSPIYSWKARDRHGQTWIGVIVMATSTSSLILRWVRQNSVRVSEAATGENKFARGLQSGAELPIDHLGFLFSFGHCHCHCQSHHYRHCPDRGNLKDIIRKALDLKSFFHMISPNSLILWPLIPKFKLKSKLVPIFFSILCNLYF